MLKDPRIGKANVLYMKLNKFERVFVLFPDDDLDMD
jgi:hypothetical protein